MAPRKSTSDSLNESGYPAILHRLCKEEDVLIIPQFVTHLAARQVEHVSPKKSKDSKLGDRFGSNSLVTNDSKAEDILACGSLRPPQVAIAYENPDDKETPVAVICKNVYIEFSLIKAIGKSLKPYPTISSLKIENCCISKDIAEALALVLAEEPGRWITDLSLDGNAGLAQVLPLFLKFPTGLKYLSLQRCSLDDEAMKNLAECLCFCDGRDQKLQVLNLSMNKIGDAGIYHLAEALRTNRTLLSVSLAGNQIGDEGVNHLTAVLEKFPLTHEEVQLRRKRIFHMIFKKKAAIEKYIEEWKLKGEVDSQASKNSTKSAERTGRKFRGLDGRIRCLSSRDRRTKPNQTKMNPGEKFRGKTRSGADESQSGGEPTPSEILAIVQQVESEMPPDKHPFVNEVSLSENGVLCVGCWSLGNINLAYNYLTERSVERFTEVFYSQSENLVSKAGLIRLVLLPGNLFQENLAEFQKLQTAVVYRNTKKDASEGSDLAGTSSGLFRNNDSRESDSGFEEYRAQFRSDPELYPNEGRGLGKTGDSNLCTNSPKITCTSARCHQKPGPIPVETHRRIHHPVCAQKGDAKRHRSSTEPSSPPMSFSHRKPSMLHNYRSQLQLRNY